MSNPENLDLTEDRGFVLQVGILYGAVCVPKAWSDDKILAFIDREVGAAGTTLGWALSEPDPDVADGEVRVQCPDEDSRVHVLFNC